jgi:hypothetical protein
VTVGLTVIVVTVGDVVTTPPTDKVVLRGVESDIWVVDIKVVELVELDPGIIELEDLRAVEFTITTTDAVGIEGIVHEGIVDVEVSSHKALLAPFPLIGYRIVAVIVTQPVGVEDITSVIVTIMVSGGAELKLELIELGSRVVELDPGATRLEYEKLHRSIGEIVMVVVETTLETIIVSVDLVVKVISNELDAELD